MEKLKQLHEKRADLHQQIKTLVNERESDWTAEDESKYQALNAAYDANLAELEAEQKRVTAEADRKKAFEDRLSSLDKHSQASSRIGRDGASILEGPRNRSEFPQTDREERATGAAADKQFALALQGWLRAPGPQTRGALTEEHYAAAKALGISLQSNELVFNLNPDFGLVRSSFLDGRGRVTNALSSQDGSTGGYSFGETFVANLELAMLAYGNIYAAPVEVMRTADGSPLRWPTANDTANTGAMLGENTAVSSTAQPSFGQRVWYAYKFTSNEILVPYELLQNSAFNIAQILANMLGERLGRIKNNKFTVGTGAAEPYGIATVAVTGVTAASATAIAFDELIDLEHSLDLSRRNMPGVGYMMHDTILKSLRKLKDGEGRYLWQAGANSGAPDTLNTYPYWINQDMQSSIATGTKTVLFGQMSCFKIREVGAIRMYRLTERHRESDQDAFLAFSQGDSNILNAGDDPIKALVQA